VGHRSSEHFIYSAFCVTGCAQGQRGLEIVYRGLDRGSVLASIPANLIQRVVPTGTTFYRARGTLREVKRSSQRKSMCRLSITAQGPRTCGSLIHHSSLELPAPRAQSHATSSQSTARGDDCVSCKRFLTVVRALRDRWMGSLPMNAFCCSGQTGSCADVVGLHR
jgi:hypothetical protein